MFFPDANPVCWVKEAGKGFLLHVHAQYAHAITNMHTSENTAVVHI